MKETTMSIKDERKTGRQLRHYIEGVHIRCAVLMLLLLSASVTSYGFDYIYKGVIFRCKANGDNSVTVKSWRSRTTKSVTVPATVLDERGKSYNVTSLDVYVSGDSYSTERLVIEEGVSRIEDRCFHEFFRLKSVKLPYSVTYLGVRAFGNVKSSQIYDLLAECDNRDLVVEALLHSNYKGGVYLSSGVSGNAASHPTPPAPRPAVKEERPVADSGKAPDAGALVIRARRFFKVENSLEAVKGKMFDHTNRPCALVKVTIAHHKPSYSSNDIPEPMLNYISYNVRGKDHIWMIDGATSLDVYSNTKEFEPATLFFREISNGAVKALESGCVYELQLRVEYER